MVKQTLVPQKRRSDAPTQSPRRLRVIFHRDPARIGQSWLLSHGEQRLGRDTPVFNGAALGDPKISGSHLLLNAPTPSAVYIRDLNSSNGSFVNGERIDTASLQLGDTLRIGDTFLVLTDRATPADHPRFLGHSAGVARVHEAIQRVAPHESTVLIVGETGTGKDLVAQEVHRLSGRRGPYVTLNCGAVPTGLIESELFGHTKGAFSGADRAKPGMFDAANGGTLFLDEIGEMPLAMQAKLLRVLQNKTIRAVGAQHAVAIDTRVIAATNVDLIAAINDGQFRSDLYSRLAEWVIDVPSLRSRREDIPLLVLAQRGKAMPAVSPELIAALLDHDFPFNVRELIALVAQCVIDGATDDEGLLVLSERAQRQIEQHQRIRLDAPGSDAPPTALPPRSADEWRELLRRFSGNVSQIAEHLGKRRTQVYRWLKAVQLDAADFRDDPH